MNENDLFLCNEAGRLSLGIHRTTWARWRSGKSRPPRAAILALRALQGEILHDGWEGWLFGRDGALYDPAGIRHTGGTIQAWHFVRQRLDALRAGEYTPDEHPAEEIRRELYRRLNPPAR